ncbi:MAG TPA: hypothetical protein VF035_08275 [Longimicrobiales bacterium]
MHLTVVLFVAVMLALPPAPASAQVRFEVSAGAAGTGAVVRDPIATGSVRDSIPGVQDELSASFATAPRLGIGVVLPMRTRTEAVMRVSWSPSSMQVQEDGGTRDVADVGIFEALLGVRSRVWRALELSGGFGGLYFNGDDAGPFSGGADIAPVLEGGFGAGADRAGHRLHVRGIVQLHRFNTDALQNARISGGSVVRYGIETSLTWKGGAR